MSQMFLSPENIRRILQRWLRRIVDVLRMPPAGRAFREALPHAHIRGVVNGGAGETGTEKTLLSERRMFHGHWRNLPPDQKGVREDDFLWPVRRRVFDLSVRFTEGTRRAVLVNDSLNSGEMRRRGRSFINWRNTSFQDFSKTGLYRDFSPFLPVGFKDMKGG